jgi:long-chain acyl-CoA synthetase
MASARFVLVPRFDAQRSFELLRSESVTFLPGVPTMFAAWGDLAEQAPPERLRWCLSAGAPMADEIVRRAEARLGAEVRQGYGLTEATFSTVNAPPDARVVGSVGRAVPGVEIRVVDAQGASCGTDRDGEIQVRGTNVMSRYLDDEDATREVFSDGWLRTGDVGRLDREGRLRVVDRIKDLIIRGGNNVYPSEVEDVLAAHPDIASVAVVGRRDSRYGEEVVAVIVPRPNASIDLAALDTFARERLASTKVPREIAIVSDLPLGPSGKVLKRVIRDRIESGETSTVRIARTVG